MAVKMKFAPARIAALVLLFAPWLLHAQNPEREAVLEFALKSAPPNLTVSLNGEFQRPVSANEAEGTRNFRITGSGLIRFSAPAHQSQEFPRNALPIRNGRVDIKLENENGIMEILGVYSTGVQPKSVFFSPDSSRLFVPLLGQHGVDVFRLAGQSLVFERRLMVPANRAAGFVEAFIDERRREIWVSNMENNAVHIFDLDTLDYVISVGTGGVFPKVITQNPAGTITVVSNWVSRDISVFDSQTKELIRRIPVGGIPRGMAFSADGRFLYAAIFDDPLIAVVDMQEHRVTARHRFHEGRGAARHVIYREGRLYVSDMLRGTVNILNASTGALLVSRRIGPNINTIALSPDGRRVFASSRGHNNRESYLLPGPDFGAIFLLRADTLAVEERIWGRNQPTGLAVSPDGRYMVFTNFLDSNMELYIDRSRPAP
ncbi:MAG: beta-propeller fold lactonase family protein [Treponema sp.]|nr:beta-propeller fold lactonase family protein [Treponema sp.]